MGKTPLRTIRASELGAYLYCHRAWWYQQQGIESENESELAGGSSYHLRHGQKVFAARLFRLGGWLLLLVALVLTAIALTLLLVG
jgi:hypothetical protein